MKYSESKPDPNRLEEPRERWGSWEDAEHWQRESFLRRTPAQRLQWLEEMLSLVYLSKRQKAQSSDQ